MDLDKLMASMQKQAGAPPGGAPDARGFAEALAAAGVTDEQGGPGGGPALTPEMMGKAQQLWKFMDNLAETDPKAYKAFLAKQARNAGVIDAEALDAIAEGKPMPKRAPKAATFLVTTTESGASGPRPVVVALWRSRDDEKKVSMRNQPGVRAVPGVGDETQRLVYDLEVSGRAVEKALAEPEYRATLIEAAFRCAEYENNTMLDRATRKLFTNRDAAEPVQRAKQATSAATAAAASSSSAASALKPETLQQLATLGLQDGKPPGAGASKNAAPKKPVIEVVSEAPAPELEHTMEVEADAEGAPAQLVVRVSLPGTASAADADLEVGPRSVYVSAAAGTLTLALPHPVDESRVKAKLQKATSTLVLRLPVTLRPGVP